MSDFFQAGPALGNQYEDDAVLQAWLRRHLPAAVLEVIQPGLIRLGARVATEFLAMAADAETRPPRHIPYDPWGRRVDEIRVAHGWRELNTVAAEEAIVATAYQRRHGEWSRVHQFARLYLYHPSSAIYSCPLAMTDGAARLIELHGDDYLKREIYPRLIATDPAQFWTAGQWMTERTGGSDVSGTSTVARPGGGSFLLFGDKWFTSAATAPMAMTLARIEDANGVQQDLSLFYVETRDTRGRLRNIRINRLKDKLGTRALPTAELTLQGTPARLVGEPGRGVRTISTILNITRLYNVACAAGYMRRGLALAADYGRRRRVFGKLLVEQPLFRATMLNLDAEFRAAFHLVFFLATLLGREETGKADEQDRGLLRLLTPVAKLYTAKQAVAVISEVLECFGGAGYVEDTGLPVLLRDAQVLPIWEGTTNVLSLDMLRVMEKSDALQRLLTELRHRLDTAAHPEVAPVASMTRALLQNLESRGSEVAANPLSAQTHARQFAYAMTRAVCAVLLLEHADWALRAGDPDKEAAIAAARRWCESGGMPLAEG